ncbi:5-methyltetrahydropteroyltriglutamate--homocysteine methyltransferase [Sulfodiicoccus acidiphilus]|uniref:5-methyltetrahydropteroyltriglutamate--homocysteine methyltransferase n=1 Tax=Sulfodiicoccus acidiphilus TaxID=1670455 RepID=A0A348B190_9CREN|nr:hypothetical protein [Sulfodiicoccus acidiphilus]BBD71942.1 5-methyltetrahydropteroyltriglutamate--homocysteine methyltransferase [Sulfodiicoccus acidiphilus]GGT91634.1 5-methyltetrahydropteroyltriglutamate--homocysteine methyltransferase [Sulfodiicoccus acidiphilus]
MKTALLGSFPRSRVISKHVYQYRQGKFPENKLMEEVSRATGKLMELAKGASLDYVTGGNFLWDDIVDMACSQVYCGERRELVRFYENNFYYREPMVNGPLEVRDQEYVRALSIFRKEFDEKLRHGESKLKASFLGPLSFTSLSQDSHYGDKVELAFAYAKAVNQVMRDSEPLVDVMEIQDPSIFDSKVDKKLRARLGEIYQTVTAGVGKEKHLITYFFLEPSLLKEFFELPVDVYGVDLVEGKARVRQVYRFTRGKRFYLGLLDARSTKLERISTLRRVAERFSERGAVDVVIGFNSFADFIPEVVAVRKLRLLGKVKSK